MKFGECLLPFCSESSVFHLLSENLKLKQFYRLFCMCVKLGLSHQGKKVDWGCMRTGCWGEYLDLRGRKWQGVGEVCIMRSFIPYTLFFFPMASTVRIGPWPSLMDFSIHRHLVGLLGWGISPTQGLYPNTQTHIYAPSRIRTCDPNVQAVVDSTCLRPLGCWDRQLLLLTKHYSGHQIEDEMS
jgi:hypothetical protein